MGILGTVGLKFRQILKSLIIMYSNYFSALLFISFWDSNYMYVWLILIYFFFFFLVILCFILDNLSCYT